MKSLILSTLRICAFSSHWYLGAFTHLATDRRWHAMNPADAVDLLKKEYDKHSKVAKRQWVVQNAPELIEEHKKLLRQEGR